MDSTTDEMTSGETSATDALESEIEKTRDSMSSTLEQLHGKLNPAVLKDQALEQFHQAKEAVKADVRAEIEEVKTNLRRELAEAKSEFREATIGKVEHMVDDAQQTVKDTGNGLLQAMRDNPIPTALVGIGLGWLFVNARSRRTQQPTRTVEMRAGQLGKRVASEASQLARGVGDRAGSLAHDAQDRAKHALDAATDGMTSMATRVGEAGGVIEDGVETFARDAGRTAVQWEGSVEKTLRENPLPIGAIALALGLAAGLAIPSTKMEDEWVGPLRDDALDEVEAFADQALGTVEQAAGKLVEAAKPDVASA